MDWWKTSDTVDSRCYLWGERCCETFLFCPEMNRYTMAVVITCSEALSSSLEPRCLIGDSAMIKSATNPVITYLFHVLERTIVRSMVLAQYASQSDAVFLTCKSVRLTSQAKISLPQNKIFYILIIAWQCRIQYVPVYCRTQHYLKALGSFYV